MSVRMTSSWRKKVYGDLVQRDGATCASCGACERTIWRQQGVTVSDDWEWPVEEPWLRPRYTITYPSSNLEVDHKAALHIGGTNDLDNLWLLCRDCHKRKTSREQSQRLKALFAKASQ